MFQSENMIKRTLYFGNPAYLSCRLEQLVIRSAENSDEDKKNDIIKTIPIEEIGLVVIDDSQITLTSRLIESLLEENVAIITCNSKHLPVGLMLSLIGHSVQNERIRLQLATSLPLKKSLWQQTIEYKIRNQAAVLKYVTNEDAKNMLVWAGSVKSGDSDNLEARAAAFYWKNIFTDCPEFIRGQYEDYPNNLLNYGYAILRGIVARALVASGMLPVIGINHHNRYNDYCLADDIMEPYRPYVDKLVINIMKSHPAEHELTKDIKAKLLSIPVLDVEIDGHTSPLMVAATTTTASLFKCFQGVCRKIIYPVM